MVRIKRIYELPEASDGYRALVDRLWPRGISREKAALDEWLKDAAPSSELRVWFGHKPDRFEEFSRRYMAELEENKELQDQLHRLKEQHKTITLLYAAHDPKINHAIVLQGFIDQLPSK